MVTIVPPPAVLVKTKADVRFEAFTPALAYILTTLTKLAQDPTCPTLLITSGSDGAHSKVPLSRHYSYEAVDLMSHHLKGKDKSALKARLEQALGPQFTVLLEDDGMPNEHLHVQVTKGHKYHPEAA